jgi:hypothetical protein
VENDAAGTPAAEAGYENTADERWALQALDFYRRGQLQVEAFDTDGVVSAQVWGTCPRCGHEMNVQMTLTAPIGGLRAGRGLWGTLTGRDVPPSSGIPDTVEAGCGCGQVHSGAPGELTGCGVSFRLPTAPIDGAGTLG